MRNSKRVGLLAAFGGAAAVVATAVAMAAGTALGSSVSAAAYRLTATLTPNQVVPAVQAPAGAIGHFHGILIRTGIGAARMAALAGCKVVAPPPSRFRQPGIATRVNCGGTVSTLPSAPNQWRLFWRLTYSHLSGPATSAAIHVAPVGQAAAPLLGVCAPCGALSHGRMVVSTDQANALLNNAAYVDVATAAHPGGEIRGQIVPIPEPSALALLGACAAGVLCPVAGRRMPSSCR